ncbi:hypothetical protein ACS0TY_015634 [Phlomoides rotata]
MKFYSTFFFPSVFLVIFDIPNAQTVSRFPFFGKKYQLKFSGDTASETHCLLHFPSMLRLGRDAGLDDYR